MLCDLHIHSFNSSGSQTVEEICKEAVSKNIKLISLTEDDTISSYKELATLAPKYGLNYILGVEVSASLEGSLFRFLAYDFDINNTALQELLASNTSVWEDLGVKVVHVYAKYHHEVSVEDYMKFEPKPGQGGFKHNKYMNSIGKDGSFNADMKFFMEHRDDTQAIKKAYRFKDVSEVLAVIHQAGGKAIVSAEYFKDKSTFESMVEEIVALGVDGFECYRKLDKELVDAMIDYAQKHNILITGGGNGHGTWADPTKYSIGLSEVNIDDLNLGSIKIQAYKRKNKHVNKEV
jgi:predicted metal-dependent phosphoesterase TrpH